MPRFPLLPRLLLSALLAALGPACRDGGSSAEPAAGNGDGDGGSGGGAGPATPGWVVVAREDFEDGPLPSGAFSPDPVPDDGPFADGGAFFQGRGVTPPAAFRASQPFGDGGWLTLEAYSRRPDAALGQLAAVVPDPSNGANRALRLRSPEHTDGAVVRPTRALPARYRVSLRVGHAAFGDGAPGLNGYDSGSEDAGPWWPGESATSQNGFYWLAVLDALPRPHNNTWIHHHRKVVVDSDNHHPPWMEVWTGSEFVWSGERPVMMIALDGSRPGDARTGNAFLSFSDGAWQPSGAIRAVDAYLPGEWYRVAIERDGPRYALEISGRFRHGGQRTYRAQIDAAAACVWHYPVDAAEAAGAVGCEDPGSFVDPASPRWPAGGAWPDWFMFGDPHVNYYEGEVLFDDVVLEEWRG